MGHRHLFVCEEERRDYVVAIECGKVDLGLMTEFNNPKPIPVNQRFDTRRLNGHW